MRSAWTACVCCTLILAASALWSPEGLPRVPTCSFHAVTGRPCPGCGLTRSVCAISHGRWGEAWRFNPFGYLFYGLALLGAVSPLVERWRPGALGRWLRPRRLGPFVTGVLAAMFVFGAVRFAAHGRGSRADRRPAPVLTETLTRR